jgi:hypothetical protein
LVYPLGVFVLMIGAVIGERLLRLGYKLKQNESTFQLWVQTITGLLWMSALLAAPLIMAGIAGGAGFVALLLMMGGVGMLSTALLLPAIQQVQYSYPRLARLFSGMWTALVGMNYARIALAEQHTGRLIGSLIVVAAGMFTVGGVFFRHVFDV